jgi:hypothetical protein
MGAYTCEYGVVHKVCRCPTPHTIKCDKVAEHSGTGYTPKHRGEPVVKYRITVVERERGWGADEWTEDFDSEQEAWDRIKEINSKNTAPVAPDYYVQAVGKVTKVVL